MSPALAPGAEPPGTSALERLVDGLALQVQRAGVSAPVAIYTHGSAPELARSTATLLASRLALQKLAPQVLDARSASDAEARARAQHASAVVRIEVALSGDQLIARGDLLGTHANFWSGAAAARPPRPAAVLLSQTRADPAVLTLVAALGREGSKGPVTLTRALLTRLSHPPAALTTGDIDLDGTPEILVLTESVLSVYAFEGTVRAQWPLTSLPLAEAPCREPFGALSVHPTTGNVALLSSRHKDVVELAWRNGALQPASRLEQLPVGMGLKAVPVLGQNVLELQPQTGPAPAPVFSSWTAFKNRLLFMSPGGKGTWVPHSTASAAQLWPLGVGSVLLDVDADGEPELLYSKSDPRPEQDLLRLVSLSNEHTGDITKLSVRWESEPIRGQVVLASKTDFDRDQMDEALLGVWTPEGGGEVLLLRRGQP